MIYKESPLCSWGSAFGHESAESLPACLINLLPESFGALSASESSCNISGDIIWDLDGGVFTSLLLAQLPQPARHHWTMLIQGREPLSQWVPVAQKNLERLGNQTGSTAHYTGKNPGSNSDLPQEAEGESDQLSICTLVTAFLGVKPCLSGSGSRVEVLSCVGVYENTSLRRSLVTKRVWRPDPWVHRELIWSRVNPNSASGPGLIWTHYGQEMPNFLQGEWPEMDEVSGVICSPLCAGEEDPLPPLHSPYPFCLCLCLDVWHMGGMGGGQSKNTTTPLTRVHA
jgi:hypothetical protein